MQQDVPLNTFTLNCEGVDIWEQHFPTGLPPQTEKGCWDTEMGVGGGVWWAQEEQLVENEGDCFPPGAWIDEETPQTEEALLWVSFRGGGWRSEYACWEIDRLLSAIDTLSIPPPISSSLSINVLPSCHGCIVAEKWQLGGGVGDKSIRLFTFLVIVCKWPKYFFNSYKAEFPLEYII